MGQGVGGSRRKKNGGLNGGGGTDYVKRVSRVNRIRDESLMLDGLVAN